MLFSSIGFDERAPHSEIVSQVAGFFLLVTRLVEVVMGKSTAIRLLEDRSLDRQVIG